MSEPINLALAFGLPPARAVEYFQAKGYKITQNWSDLWQEAQARAFTVSGVTRLDVLQDIRDQVQAGIEGKITERDFIKNLEPSLRAKGWWGPQVQVDPQTMEARIARTGSPWRLKTIYRTNLQTAYMAGRYRQMMENTKFRPFWQYVAVMDEKTRPAHAAMNGLVFRFDDPFWDHFYPPNGFNCRCTVRALSQNDIDNRGLSVRESGEDLRERWVVEPTTGLTEQIADYKGAGMQRAGSNDLGWNYNPGRAAWQPDLDGYAFDLARQYVGGMVTGPDFARFVAAGGAEQGAFPVAVLNPPDKTLLGASSQTVLLSSDSLKKQVAAHSEIGRADYANVQAIIDGGEVFRQGDNRLVYMKIDDIWYQAVVKVTQDGKELYLVTLFRTSERELASTRKTLKQVRGPGA